MSIDFNGEATIVCDREVILDRIVAKLNHFQRDRIDLLKDIKLCFPVVLIDKNNIYFPADRTKATLHFIVRGLLRINLQCAEDRLKYYGNNPFIQTKLSSLIKAASGESGFDKYPPDISSNTHPCFNKLTAEGKHASQLYGALEALRRSIRRKKLNHMPTDQVSSSSSSSSDEPSSILGKRPTTMESSPTATTNASFMESPLPGAGTSLGTSILNSIGGVKKNLGDDLKDSTLLSGGVKEILDDSVELRRGDNVRYLCIF